LQLRKAPRKNPKVKHRRHIGIFLLAISFLIPWNIAYLYQDYFAEVDFLVRKHFSAEQEDGLLSLFKENSRLLPLAVEPIQHPVISFLPAMFSQHNSFLPGEPQSSVLRC
jgi:hypothetical protein